MKLRWPIILLFASAIVLVGAVQQGFSRLHAQTELPVTFLKGFGYAAYNVDVFSSSESDAKLEMMAEMGANAVSIVGTVYQDDVNSTEIFAHYNTTAEDDPSDPYPSTPYDADFEHVIAKAHSLGMEVKLKIHVDLRDAGPQNYWRGSIDFGNNQADWDAWFESYTEIMVRYAALAEANDVELFAAGTELVKTVKRPEWNDVIEAIREVYTGELVYAANHGNELDVAFWTDVDYIGIDGYYNLSDKVNPNIPELLAAWTGPIAAIDALHDATGLPVLFTEVGYLNADGTNMQPWCYSVAQGCTLSPDPQEQAFLFEALFQTLTTRDYMKGVYVWDFRTEPSGPCHTGYTPYDKPAENVIRTWFGVDERAGIEQTCASAPVPVEPADPGAEPMPTPAPLSVRPVDSVLFDPPPASANPIKYKGMGYAQYKPGSYTTVLSDETIDAIRASGSEWVSILATWYQEDATTPEIAPYDVKSPTDIDIVHVISKAHSVGLKVLLKPHIDLKNDQGGQSWRGEIGWDIDKTPIWTDGGTEWGDWFTSYSNFIGHYAQIAQDNGVEMVSVGTELESATRPVRTDNWKAIIAEVRDIYTGTLTYAANHSGEEACVGFWPDVDVMGIDGYYNLTPKKDATVLEMQVAWSSIQFRCPATPDVPFINIDTLADMNAGELFDNEYMPVIFTEVGYRSLDGANTRPWYAYQSPEAVDLGEQVDAYEALLKTFAQKEYFQGQFFWAYDTEAEDSGPCDDGYSPHGKPVENLIRSWYGVDQRPEIETVCANPATPTPAPTPTSIIIPAPVGSGVGYADLAIYDIEPSKYVTQVFTIEDTASGMAVSNIAFNELVSNGVVPDDTQFEYGLEEKRVRDYRASDACGFIVPPRTGEYEFGISGDDAAWLMLSNDESPELLTKIASFPFYTDRFELDKYPGQVSEPIRLLEGHPYRFRILHINREGGDRFEVAWKGPGFNMQLIDESHLWPCSTAAPTPVPTTGDEPTAVPTKTPTPMETPTPVETNTPVPSEPTATTLPGEPTSTRAPTNTPVPLSTATPVVTAGPVEVSWGSSGNAGAPGSQFVLSGQNFAPNETVTVLVTFNGQDQTYTINADASGTFEAAVTTESDLPLTIFKFSVESYPNLVLSDLIVSPGASVLPPVTATQRIELTSNPPSGNMDNGVYLPWIAN